MPSTILAHQGIVLPLIIKYPRKFDGAGLVVGSFIPDLPWFITLFFGSFSERAFHSIGDLIIIVPISFLFVIFFKKIIIPFASPFALRKRIETITELLAFFGIDDCSVLRREKISVSWTIKATYSILIGIFSHFLLDLPTHGGIPYLRPFYNGVMPEWFLHEYLRIGIPFFGILKVTNYQILWLIFSIGFGILAIYCMYYMKKHRVTRN